MLRLPAALLALAGVLWPSTAVTDQAALERAVRAGAAAIELPALLVLTREVPIPPGGPLEIRGAAGGSELRMAKDFRGTAVFRARSRSHLRLAGFTIQGNRGGNPAPRGLPPWNVAFADFYRRNGVVIQGGGDITLERLTISGVADFAVIVSGSSNVHITRLTVEDSGSRNERGRNNTSGGILLEEGTRHFEVIGCTVRRVLGNAIWTHSNSGSPRNAAGRIADNSISYVGRDAIQVGHGTGITVENNQGSDIGYPADAVDVAAEATPVALDSSGNVDHSIYRDNRFRDVDGECINLDGFHDGEVRGNRCESTGPFARYPYAHYGIVMGNTNPDVRIAGVTIMDNTVVGTGYGGLYLIGSGNTVAGNHLLRLNRNHCTGEGKTAACNYALEQPGLLRSGIYLAAGAKHPDPAIGNVIRSNELEGFGIDRWCIEAAPGVDRKRNRIEANSCRGGDDAMH